MTSQDRAGAAGSSRRRPASSLALPLQVAAGEKDSGFHLLDAQRARGILLAAASGSGKSMVIAFIAFLDLVRGMAQVVFDPHGTVIDAFLLRLAQVPAKLQPALWRRVKYVDMRGRGSHFVSWPLLFELPGDTPHDIADRFLQTLKALDPHLASASVQGWNRLYKVGLPVGVVLATLGRQLSDAYSLLRHPEQWEDRLDEVLAKCPEALRAVEFFRDEYLPVPPDRRLELASTYLNKLDTILLDPTTEAFFCQSEARIDFGEAVARRQTILLDFRSETNTTLRSFKTRWAFDTIMAFVKHRGPGPHAPMAIHFDELTELTNQASLEHDLFGRDVDYLFNVIQRNYACPITAALQHLWQVSERTQQTLLSLGTHVYGTQSSLATAERIVRRYGDIDVFDPKRMEPIWMSSGGSPEVIDYRAVDFPIDEQSLLLARQMLGLPAFTFLVKPRDATSLRKVSLARYMGPAWPNEHGHFLEQLREQLTIRGGQPREIEQVLRVPNRRPRRSDRMESTDEQFYDPKPERR